MADKNCIWINGIGFNKWGVCCGDCAGEHPCENKDKQFEGFSAETIERIIKESKESD